MESNQSKEVKLTTQLTDTGRELLKKGISLVGPMSGAYIGTLSNDPSAIVLSAAIGDAVSHSINDFAERILSFKEKQNISITEAFSLSKILHNQQEGQTVNDQFFQEGVSGNAKELYNGILNAAKNNYEDKKLEFLGYFYGNIIFASYMEPQLSHFLLSTLKSLNYKQICILSLVGQHDQYFHDLKPIHEITRRENWYQLFIIQNEISNMMLNGLLQPYSGTLLEQTGERHLEKCELGTMGKFLYTLAEFDKVDEEDLLDVLKFFK